jgi:hypothetical protein
MSRNKCFFLVYVIFTDSPSYIPSFIKVESGIQMLLWEGVHRHTDSMKIT